VQRIHLPFPVASDVQAWTEALMWTTMRLAGHIRRCWGQAAA